MENKTQNRTEIKGNVIQSRFHFAPINTGLAKGGLPTEELINFHKLRSGPNLGINYIGNISINSASITNEGTLYIGNNLKEYEKLIEKVEIHGTLAGAQISSLNSQYTPLRNWINKDTDEYFRFEREQIINLSNKEIENIIKEFQVSILKMKSVGFKVIQLHAAHGYLLNRFVSKKFNARADKYGIDPFLIIKEILSGISSEIKDIIIDLRVSLFENKIPLQLEKQHINFLEELLKIEQVDMLSISNGFYNTSKRLIYPSKQEKPNFMVEMLKDFAGKSQQKLWNFSGNIRNIHTLKPLGNYHYSIGRPLLADEDFVEKAVNNQSNINSCQYKNLCHYYSRKKNSIECGVNKKLY